MSEIVWQQVVCRTQRQHQQAISDTIESAGAVSITYQDAGDQPVLEPLPGETPLWNDIIITGLFQQEADNIPTLLFSLKENSDWAIKELKVELLEDQDWERVWMKDFHPMQFGENLWVYPSSSEIPNNDSVKILLDPGLAFGTGTHPTTALCLEWLDQNPPKHQQVLDYGCGSGILSIAAAKLGATAVMATDIDKQALLATKDNMQRNQVSETTLLTCLPDKLHTSESYDVVIANILSEPLIALRDQLLGHLKPSGFIALSGILETQKDAVLTTYKPYLTGIEIKQMDDWIRISGQKIVI